MLALSCQSLHRALPTAQTKKAKEIRTVKRLLRVENNDREILYKELATANKIDPADIAKVKTIFANTLTSKAKPGHWYHDENGNWMQKK